MRKIFSITLLLFSFLTVWAQHTAGNCQGSLSPYPEIKERILYPDSLTPIFMNHVGRHGSRYPAGSTSAKTMQTALERAVSLGTITPLGLQFKEVIENIIIRSLGQWGELDSLGMAEQRGIARRMFTLYPQLFTSKGIVAQSSHSPRSIMSMYCFTHELARRAKGIDIATHAGPRLNATLRPFDENTAYQRYMQEKPYQEIYQAYVDSTCPIPVTRLLGDGFPDSVEELKQLSIIEYYNIANMQAMGMKHEWEPFLTLDEYSLLWSCYNLRQYLMQCQSSLSFTPASIAAPLVQDIVETFDMAVKRKISYSAKLRFAHQETVMPLYSLLKLEGCHFMTSNWSDLKNTFQDYRVVPMASNLQLVLFKSKTGHYYLRCDLNEQPIPLIEGSAVIYTPWNEARQYMMTCAKHKTK